MTAKDRIAATTQISSLYSSGGVNVHPHVINGSLGQHEFASQMPL